MTEASCIFNISPLSKLQQRVQVLTVLPHIKFRDREPRSHIFAQGKVTFIADPFIYYVFNYFYLHRRPALIGTLTVGDHYQP